VLKVRPYQRYFAWTWRNCFLPLHPLGYCNIIWLSQPVTPQTSAGLARPAVLKMIFVLYPLRRGHKQITVGVKLSQQNTCWVRLSFAVLGHRKWTPKLVLDVPGLALIPLFPLRPDSPLPAIRGPLCFRVFLSILRLSLDWLPETWFSRKDDFGLTAST